MAADALGAGVGPHHHGRGVPADVGPDAALEVLVAGEPRLGVGRDGVHVGGRDGGREVDLLGPGPLEELHQQVAGPGPALGVDDGVEGVEPLRRLARVDVGHLVADPVEQHASTVPAGGGAHHDHLVRVLHIRHGTAERARHRLHRRGLPGNPGPGGWAWAVPGGPLASGAEPATTNQRMEITAALEALRCADGRAPSRNRGGERLDLRRQLLQGPLVAGLAAAELAELAEQAGGQPRPVGAAARARAGARRPTSASAGSRATRATRWNDRVDELATVAADAGHRLERVRAAAGLGVVGRTVGCPGNALVRGEDSGRCDRDVSGGPSATGRTS